MPYQLGAKVDGDIDANGISKHFGSVAAVSEVSLKSRRGINMVLGPNGAGKSTLLRCMDGLYKPDAGRISVLGTDPYLNHNLKAKLSLISDVYGLYDFLTVKDNIRLFGRLLGMRDNDISYRSQSILRDMDAMEYLNKRVETLSRGTKQKIAFCRAVLNDPDVLLMDEPTAFLDSKSSNYVREKVREYDKAGKTVVFVTQRIDEVTRFNSRILIMRKGKIVKDTNSEGLYEDVLRNSYVNIRLAKPVELKLLQSIKGFMRANSQKPTMFSLRIKGYKDISAALKQLLEKRAYVVSVDYVEPFIEELSFGED